MTPKGLTENIKVDLKGAPIDGNARREIEAQTVKTVIIWKNARDLKLISEKDN